MMMKMDTTNLRIVFSYVTVVDLVGGIHETVASLHIERWRAEMISEINRINQVLPTTPVFEKSDAI